MLKEAPGPINFTIFLTMFGEKLKGEGRFFCTSHTDCNYLNVCMTILGPKRETFHQLNIIFRC